MSGPRRHAGPGAVDWDAARERLLQLQSTLAGGIRLSAEETAAVLAERARALAKPAAREPVEAGLELIAFELAGERYAIETRFVVEIVGRPEFAFLPGAQPPLIGIAGWRGELLPLLDLGRMLALTGDGAAESARLVVLGDRRASFAILVDAVLDLRELPASAIGPLPGGNGGRRFLHGSTPDAVLVLDAAELIRTHGTGAAS